MGDFEAAHGGTVLLGNISGRGPVLALEVGEFRAGDAQLFVQGAPLGVRYRAGRVLRLDAIVHQGIEEELFAPVFELVFFSPSLEHAVGELYVGQISAARNDLGLIAGAFAQARDLPQAQLAVQEARRLIMQVQTDPESNLNPSP